MSEAPCTWAGAYRPHPPAGLACDTVLRLAMPDMRGPGGAATRPSTPSPAAGTPRAALVRSAAATTALLNVVLFCLRREERREERVN
eukprot:CAMPEP_0177584824 /NCGR_PEP_ID=MMETSP0419_2-20121207/4128_1 /TAXON_ID=582737 /ORGANISM="Tetraselmis sp., Strain GSL018" /LENGTH=86 /DNA_ID=CAMNT_0019074441 /DNA_START=194 /DNA_END=453 /DNA_ORIENTATION=+